LLYITQFETGCGVLVLVDVDVTRGTEAGTGVALWLGTESWMIEVGKAVGDCCRRLLLSESLVILLDDKDDVVIFVEPHAASSTISERLSSDQCIFSLKQ
jgi:hypothetical protein